MKTKQRLLTLLVCVFCNVVWATDDSSTQLPEAGENSTGPSVDRDVDRYTDPDELARNKEIKELKCAICQTRCKIVYEAGTSTCRKENGNANNGCQQKGDAFAKQCLDQCTEC